MSASNHRVECSRGKSVTFWDAVENLWVAVSEQRADDRSPIDFPCNVSPDDVNRHDLARFFILYLESIAEGAALGVRCSANATEAWVQYVVEGKPRQASPIPWIVGTALLAELQQAWRSSVEEKKDATVMLVGGRSKPVALSIVKEGDCMFLVSLLKG